MDLDHNEGFEKEAAYLESLAGIVGEHPTFKNRLLKQGVEHLCPDFTRGLFERRPCVRTLKYLGYHWCDEGTKLQLGDDDLVTDQIYESETYNGATYTLKGCSRPIGCAYFERLK